MSGLWDETAGALLTATAGADPTPGGGSVAALSGAFGLGLVSMALSVTARRADANTAELLGRVGPLLPRLQQHADEDVRVFAVYMAAHRLPRGTDDEQGRRREALRAAALQATHAPLSAARDLVRALELAAESAGVAAVSVVSDVGAGAALLGGALRATLLTVDINVRQLDAPARLELLAERDALLARGEQLERSVLRAVGERLAPPER